ncbi:hypothetical protein MTR_7g029605 [Medicago truncatula]|uniref:Uncharacterized protein n=1 Tax=Medicago truncatula TaxID=3880 RepID=A0A072U887_MEDTR|nr:hypothetical protein MTR_7g029605 [Medicago truncatula]
MSGVMTGIKSGHIPRVEPLVFFPRGVTPGKMFATGAFASAFVPSKFPHKRPFSQGFCPFLRDFVPDKRFNINYWPLGLTPTRQWKDIVRIFDDLKLNRVVGLNYYAKCKIRFVIQIINDG